MYKGPDFFHKVRELGVVVKNWKLSDEVKQPIGPSHQSNFFKWQQLGEDGGLYSDMDILFTRSVDDWITQLEQTNDVSLCCCSMNPGHRDVFSIGLMWSTGDVQFFRDLYKHSVGVFNPKSYQSAGVDALYALLKGSQVAVKTPALPRGYSWKDILIAKYPETRFEFFPKMRVYPWNWAELSNIFETTHTQLAPMTIGIHWYAGAMLAQTYNQLLMPETLGKYPSTFTHYVGKCLI
jgi:hypothetical protein